ncbi:hypothetical protein HU200_002759 [Digitaria exilis]|uniref:Uncharacterized protein n=1 Tax=Digitaria exilis TaxID=1010633 RepID=A0A835FY14_9POAL|nr:hypothetical protein HU200_002759 [Digitaria exilis]
MGQGPYPPTASYLLVVVVDWWSGGDDDDDEEEVAGRTNGMGRGGGMGNPVNVGIAVQADWENREFISNISLNVRRLFDFLLKFGQLDLRASSLHFSSPSLEICGRLLISKLASLNEKLDILERKLEVLEVQVSSATTNPSVFN